VTPDELSERLLDFAVQIGKLVGSLPKTRLGNHVAGQLIRSGTSPAPNYEEGCAAENRIFGFGLYSNPICFQKVKWQKFSMNAHN